MLWLETLTVLCLITMAGKSNGMAIQSLHTLQILRLKQFLLPVRLAAIKEQNCRYMAKMEEYAVLTVMDMTHFHLETQRNSFI